MVRTRVLEEQLIQLMRKGEGFFWTGGPGEEALNVGMGLLLNKGKGVQHDYFHPHYRNTGVVLTMGRPMEDSIRQMRNSSKDPYTGGRNFVSHSCVPEWNVTPVTSPVGSQCLVGIGTALAQRKNRVQGKPSPLSLSVIGDATSATPDFASALIWSSRPQNELPLLIVVSDNEYGISTKTSTQLSAIGKRAKSFGTRCITVDGSDPMKLWPALCDAFSYVREESKPCLFQAKVSRLYGHSSSSGGNRVPGEACPIDTFEIHLKKLGFGSADFKRIKEDALQEFRTSAQKCKNEPLPSEESLHDHTFQSSDLGGLPRGKN